MSRIDLNDFLASQSAIAMRMDSSQLPGLLSKSLRIPENTTGWARRGMNPTHVVQPGEQLTGEFTLMLVKTSPIKLPFLFDNLRSADGHEIHVRGVLTLKLTSDLYDALDLFSRNTFVANESFSIQELAATLGPEIQRVLGAFTSEHDAEELHGKDHARAVSTFLEMNLERALFGTGLQIDKVHDLSLSAPEWDKTRMQAAEDAAEHDARMAAVENKETLLKRMSEMFKDNSVQELLAGVPDDQARGVIYARLMNDPDLGVDSGDLVRTLEGWGEDVVPLLMRSLQGILSEKTDEHQIIESPPALGNARRILCVAGRTLLIFDAANPTEPIATHEFEQALRSVRQQEHHLLVGVRDGILMGTLENPLNSVKYPYPGARSPRGGTNAAWVHGEFLFASHSELGIASWKLEEPESGQLIFEEATIGNDTTRGVQVAEDELLYFASGPDVFSGALGDWDALPKRFISPEAAAITSVEVGPRYVYAGTQNGAVLAWDKSLPSEPIVLCRRKGRIMTLKIMGRRGLTHLLLGSGDASLTARLVGQNLETDFESDGLGIGVAAAADDLYVGLDIQGARLFVWDPDRAQPIHRINVRLFANKPVYDIWLETDAPDEQS